MVYKRRKEDIITISAFDFLNIMLLQTAFNVSL